MKKYLVYFKNKFILTSTIFVIYALFLDDNDLFSMVTHANKLRNLEKTKIEVSKKLERTKFTLKQMRYTSEVERYAREKKFFKRDNEDIFVITYE
jgi:cell division protein DivIC